MEQAGPGLQIADLSTGASVLVDRARGQVAGLNGLTCTGHAPPPERLDLRIDAQGSALTVHDGDTLLAECTGSRDPGPVVLSAGVRRVRIDAITVNGARTRFNAGLRHWAWSLLFAGLFGAGGAALGRDRRVLGLLPLAAVPVLLWADARVLLDRMRLVELGTFNGPLVLAGVATAMTALVAWAKGPWMRHAGVTAGVALALGGAALLQSGPSWAWLALGVPLLPWGALAWVNRNPVNRRVLWSYGLLAVVLGASELTIRITPLAQGWSMSEGLQRASVEFEELLVLKEYSTYPSEGFPVRPPAPSDTPRIVAMGGSSTGGAFQMDDLDQFWPRQLERKVPGWEVVNQGVGGWNSLHVRLYAESQLATLQPDIVAVYVGHNDVLASSPVPYSQLYARYVPGQVDRTPLLQRSSAYLGFQFMVLALGRPQAGVAVSVDDARDNLAALFDAADAQGARVLLMTEGINPEPEPLADYGVMQATLASDRGGLYFDAAGYLHAQGDPDLFLDDCHLSQRGHQVLAAEIQRQLDAAGWL
jgi:lysophospholipase L1-like esterase